jgi:hypothetical protein
MGIYFINKCTKCRLILKELVGVVIEENNWGWRRPAAGAWWILRREWLCGGLEGCLGQRGSKPPGYHGMSQTSKFCATEAARTVMRAQAPFHSRYGD